MKMTERIMQLETYLSSIILGEFPNFNISTVEQGHLGVRYSMTYEYNKETGELEMDIKPILSEHSPDWLGPVLNMCLTQVKFLLDDDPIAFLKHFQTPMQDQFNYKHGDIYLNITLYDRVFMFHLPLGCVMHLLPIDTLKKVRGVRGHMFCREAITEINAREQHSK